LSFAGPLRGFEATASSPELAVLKLTMNSESIVPPLAPGLVELHLLSARNLKTLDLSSVVPALLSLTVHGARMLSLAGLPPVLRSLHLEDCAEVRDAEALLALEYLTDVWLENVRILRPQERLEALRANVRVVGRTSFDVDFCGRAPANWVFPPSARP